MTTITVTHTKENTYSVLVHETSSQTTHTVTLTDELWETLTHKICSKEHLIGQSFHFLLKREPKESILSTFDVSIISTYFPEYKEIITTLL